MDSALPTRIGWLCGCGCIAISSPAGKAEIALKVHRRPGATIALNSRTATVKTTAEKMNVHRISGMCVGMPSIIGPSSKSRVSVTEPQRGIRKYAQSGRSESEDLGMDPACEDE